MIFKFRSDTMEPVFRKITDHVKGKDDWFVIDLKESKKKRSLMQNAYYWGVVLKILSDHTGYNSDETHQEMAKMFLSYENAGKTFVKSTTRLHTGEFEQYLEKIRQWAQVEMLVRIPLPNEITEELYMTLENLRELLHAF